MTTAPHLGLSPADRLAVILLTLAPGRRARLDWVAGAGRPVRGLISAVTGTVR